MPLGYAGAQWFLSDRPLGVVDGGKTNGDVFSGNTNGVRPLADTVYPACPLDGATAAPPPAKTPITSLVSHPRLIGQAGHTVH
jgi:hypothetical protein